MTTFRIAFAGVSIDVTEGQYRKVTTKVGTAFLTVTESGELSYTNRRGENRPVSPKEFLAIWKSGINTKVSDITSVTVSGGEGSIELIEEEIAELDEESVDA